MWDIVAILSFLAFIIAIIGTGVSTFKRKSFRKKWLAVAGVAFVLFIVGVANAPPGENIQPPQTVAEKQEEISLPPETADDEEVAQQGTSGQLKAHFLDVGQGDSILIQFPNGQTMLIDAGTSEAGGAVVSYLKKEGINKINYLVATHPHADHIGGMAAVVHALAVERVYMPRVSHTTKSFENLLATIKTKGLKINKAEAGVTIINQDGIKAGFMAPCSLGYDNLNNYSAVVKVQYGSTAFLLTGDAESVSEQEMIASGANLKADVLKIGHHGSKSSTTKGFLSSVSPKYAVISCGRGNSYGHPHQETLDRLKKAGVQVYRTDAQGTVIITSDGKTLTIKTLSSTQKVRAPDTNSKSISDSIKHAYVK
ncbi:MAG: ComEC/Rec2 family competence protein [Thermacetogeniaceae bacterium]